MSKITDEMVGFNPLHCAEWLQTQIANWKTTVEFQSAALRGVAADAGG